MITVCCVSEHFKHHTCLLLFSKVAHIEPAEYRIQKNIYIIIIPKKINLNDHFTVSGLAGMEIGLGRKFEILQN